MRYSTVFKFIAIVLCAASLLGMIGSGAGIVALTNLGSKSVEQTYTDRLYNQAVGYAQVEGQAFASQELGGAPQNLINRYVGNDWANAFFNWTRVGYTFYDNEGTVLREQPIPDDSYDAEQEYLIPITGTYMKVVNTYPYEEAQPLTEPVRTGTQVNVMPSQERTAVHAIIVDYTDGSRQEWHYDGTQRGALEYSGGNTVTFLSNVGELPMGDGWYPTHILFADSGGNVVYEAYDDTLVVQGSSLDGSSGMIEWYLPAVPVTTAAPIGLTYTDGDYTSYDAIPAQGVTATSMTITYANPQGEVMGSEGVASPELIGTLFHALNGNVEFRSNGPMRMEIPEDSIIVDITFADSQNNALFEASCPGGVGVIQYDENDTLIFRGQMPGTVIPETVPQETDAEETEATEAQEEAVHLTGFAREKLQVYNAPNTNAEVAGNVDAWEEIKITTQKTFDGESWGLVSEGWVLMDKVLMEETVAGPAAMTRAADIPVENRNIYAAPGTGSKILGTLEEGQEPEIIREDIFNGMRWGLTAEGWILLGQATEDAAIPAPAAETVPEETVFPEATEAATISAEAPEETMEPAAAAEEETLPMETYPASDVESDIYYDSGTQQQMVVEYVLEPIPEGYTMTVSLAPGALRNELGWTLLRLAETFEHLLLELLGICIAVFALCVVHLCCSAGRTRRDNNVRAGGLNRIPLDLYLMGGGFGITGLLAAAFYGSEYFARNDEQLAIIFCGACAYFACLLLVAFFFAFVAQIKTPGGYWWRNTLCGRCLRLLVHCGQELNSLGKKCWTDGRPAAGSFFRWLKRTCVALWIFAKQAAIWLRDTGKRLLFWFGSMAGKWFQWTAGKLARFFGMLPITWQFLTTGFSLVVLLYAMMRTYKVGYILLGFGIFFATILYAASAFAILLENAKKMSKGDLDTKVDDRMLIGGFREFAERLNDLADVAVVAAQKQLKSERMKTELITNVSHDIKTPLTSIINYVDLLQKPHTQEQQTQYLDVLERQSQRLKKLIDDLMEMSKASTGNMAVDIETVDAAEAVNQALGEFADKLERAQLTPVFRQPEEQVFMMADGRLVWRVMSNLLGNAVKYALPGTRIYLDLLEMDGKVIISMKNISREELNVHADELMERFVRGDTSRNTEGSGLGLNIAQSLMELQKGQLQILVDGDLFKVTLIFPGT